MEAARLSSKATQQQYSNALRQLEESRTIVDSSQAPCY